MSKLDKYNEYCILVSKLDAKTLELREISTRRNRLLYEVESLKKDLEDKKDISEMNPEEISTLRRLRMRSCLNSKVYYEDGGSLSESPISEFKKSKDFKELDIQDKRLFNKIKEEISDSQYSIQNAILIAQSDDEDFDVYDSSIIEDYIDESMERIPDYEEISVQKLRKIKQIMYKFVEQVSKM